MWGTGSAQSQGVVGTLLWWRASAEIYRVSSGGQNSKTKMPAGLVSSKASFLGYRWLFSLCLLRVFPLCVCVLISMDKDTNHTGPGPILTIPFYLIYLIKELL